MLKNLSSRVQYFWRLAIPLWLFRDAGRGTAEQRIANYRYNRAQRKVLPFYLWKWLGISVCMMQLTQALAYLMENTSAETADHLCATLACMSAGIGFAFSCVVIAVLSASYLYLCCVER
jgi:drug/metabolite transporter (DMT)-like permease